MKSILLVLVLVFCCASIGAQIKVGVGKVNITPDTAIWMSGYASRNKPSEGVLQDIWTKAVVIEENSKNRVVIITADIIGFSHSISQEIIGRIMSEYGFSRSQIILNASHTHSAPVIWPSLSVMYDLSQVNMGTLVRYSLKLEDNVVNAVGTAMKDLEPCLVYTGHGRADIAVNRRQTTDKGVIIGVNPEGPVDSDVLVMKFITPDKKLKALLFGYACHNTTLSDYMICGDYAGFAQSDLEQSFPGTVAMFMEGCGADQNPDPRRSVDIARKHGQTLADAVIKALDSDLLEVHAPIKTSYCEALLEFGPFDPDKYRKELVKGNKYEEARAKLMLEAWEKGYNTTTLAYPVQVVRFNNDLTILALSGEVVVDYSLKIKKMFPGENIFVAGYCTEVPCYIPSKRILLEGGYEPETSMIYYGLPGPFSTTVEDRIMTSVRRVMKGAGAGRTR